MTLQVTSASNTNHNLNTLHIIDRLQKYGIRFDNL